MIKAYVVHRKDLNNVGDIAANPLQYFLKQDEYEAIDILDVNSTHFDDGIPVIAGGGGLIENDFIGDELRNLTQSSDINQLLEFGNLYWQNYSRTNRNAREEFFKELNDLVKRTADKLVNIKGPRIVWGAGHNAGFDKKFKGKLSYPAWLQQFDAVGIRDFGQQYDWVPCASCMHPALRKKYTIKNDVIWFEHKKQLIKTTDIGPEPVPRFINSGNNIEQTIELLGSANTIITNSYHGAYWGTLLGKKVIVVEAWSSKFNALKHKPFFLSKAQQWQDFVEGVPVYRTALDECIDTTESFWNNKVKGYIA